MGPPACDVSGVNFSDVSKFDNRGEHKAMSILASTSNDLKFHQWPDGTFQQNYLPANYNEGPIKSISWSKDGSWLVVVPHSGPAEVISIKENVKLLQTIQDIYNPTCATFQNGTKKNIAIGTLAGQVLVYDIKGRAVRKRFPRTSSTIFSIQYNAKDTHIAAACKNGEILLFSNATSNISSSYKVPKSDSVSVINFHRTKRNLLGAGSEEGIVATWDINTNSVQSNVLAHHGPITDISFSPIRSDLLVTSGLDRRFAFYDLLAKKCVLEVEVSSSVTSLDFSYCGMYLGLGSQNGNIVLYDTRNLSKPISAFAAHEGKKIHHLFFQKVPISPDEQDCSSTFDIPLDEHLKQSFDKVSKNNIVDSLGLVVCDDSNPLGKDEHPRKLSQDVEDSFLAAMGLDNSNLTDGSVKQGTTMGLGITEEVKKWMDITKRSSLPVSLNLQSISEQPNEAQTPSSSIKQISSTPKYIIQELPASSMSPIVGANGDVPIKQISSTQFSLPPAEMKQMIREVVKEEFQTQMKEVRMEFADMLTQMRRHFLDLQMSLAKEFVAMETMFDRTASNVTVREFVCDDFLINQNNQLLREVDSLKQKLIEKDAHFRRNY